MLINFDHVSLTRNKHQILNNISWQMAENENWAILGLNGSGKTTLLKILTGYLWPSEGQVEVLGETFGQTSIPELKKRIGWISTDLQYRLRDSDLAEEIVLSGKFGSIGIWEKVVEEDYNTAKELLSSCGGGALIGKKYAFLSQGERQLVIIARALMSKPELLIYDEPCNGLDLFAREALLKRIEQLTKQKKANGSIFVTHYVEEIPDTFKKVILLKNGEIFASGSRDTILTETILSQFYGNKVTVVPIANNRFTIIPK